jgi:hypothetical protein
LAAGCDTSISRRMACPSFVSTMPAAAHNSTLRQQATAGLAAEQAYVMLAVTCCHISQARAGCSWASLVATARALRCTTLCAAAVITYCCAHKVTTE